MHPEAKKARLKDLEIHPDRKIIPFEKKENWHLYEIKSLNKIDISMEIQFVSPEIAFESAKTGEWQLISLETGTLMNWVCDGHPCALYTKSKLSENSLVRAEDPEFVEGKIRNPGR